MSNIVSAQIANLATTLNMANVDEQHMKQTLTNTVFKNATDEQLVTLLIVANQYKLNPFTKEIYAFPSRGGITPIVSIDGWLRIINGNQQHDGVEFEQDDDSCTCKIYRKDRSHPTVVTEYLSECQGTSEPWKKYPKRMLRHKALIQCARVAYGYSGIYDEDEAQRIEQGADFKQPMKDIELVDEAYEQFVSDHYSRLEQVAQEQGTQELQNAYKLIPSSQHKNLFWAEYGETLKHKAQQRDQFNAASAEVVDVEPVTA